MIGIRSSLNICLHSLLAFVFTGRLAALSPARVEFSQSLEEASAIIPKHAEDIIERLKRLGAYANSKDFRAGVCGIEKCRSDLVQNYIPLLIKANQYGWNVRRARIVLPLESSLREMELLLQALDDVIIKNDGEVNIRSDQNLWNDIIMFRYEVSFCEYGLHLELHNCINEIIKIAPP